MIKAKVGDLLVYEDGPLNIKNLWLIVDIERRPGRHRNVASLIFICSFYFDTDYLNSHSTTFVELSSIDTFESITIEKPYAWYIL